ncbi:TPA: conjugative transfer signal peptidase TraF [Legionella pneumophila]|uniref:conjugative transfer signal peptidase TraF n=1 Tax=Legionella pneumophila TaxID=446 RepID=UPI001374CCDD|nr:conjugative transfer signal peptidase TraF [Legionella pneumophila]HAT9326914.1 conjugative transfer signal peptidase TraF [Legionella pneumophila subsp. pneumophila]MCK1858726.1 conjugative transfer signal peptidase TraF [Legionella pneumophila]HAT1811114.1 conjugative transfer signal peptidase TraF [Legionella pneumophila]HAT2028485.1 conjugative transfer signal peptidase TraF [Legionella pneumophila]HAT8308148.1 conjugative transfer signal peptidase TraF [Legionella pneumophila]
MKKSMVVLAWVLISLLAAALLLCAWGLRINLTHSIPVGFYRIISTPIAKNGYVIFCPDRRASFQLAAQHGYIDHGLCSSGYGYLMKQIVAVKGDRLSVTSEGVFINHKRLPLSKPKPKDGLNRALPQWRIQDYKLQEGDIMTMTNQSEWSFDGRYYGLVHTGQIKGMLTPLWVINQRENTA